jgi:hypothetical protein
VVKVSRIGKEVISVEEIEVFRKRRGSSSSQGCIGDWKRIEESKS